MHARFLRADAAGGVLPGADEVGAAGGVAAGRDRLCAPVSEFETEVPDGSISVVLQKLHAHRATPEAPVVTGTRCRITGVIPTEEIDEFEQRLPGLTGGEGVFFSVQPVTSPPP